MPDYDSDSSIDVDGEYTTTNVILGFAADEASGDDISHVGGHSKWIDEKLTPDASLARCKACGAYLSLLLQLNADLQQHFPHDTRRIYVWACKSRKCSRKPGSIRAFREVKKSQQSRSEKPSDKSTMRTEQSVQSSVLPDLGSALFGGSSSTQSPYLNPFSTGAATQVSTLNPFSSTPQLSKPDELSSKQESHTIPPLTESFAERLNIKASTTDIKAATVKTPWPETSAFPTPFPQFYLDAYPEELEPVSKPDAASGPSRTQYDVEDSSNASGGKEDSDMNIDKTFQKFSDIVAQNPEQTLRYEFQGQPLLYSGSDGVAIRFIVPHGKAGAAKGIPRCENCGAQRVFELQLMPYLIFEIEKNETLDIEDGMEWGTIIVGCCADNCGEPGSITFREEWAGVQWEERVSAKK